MSNYIKQVKQGFKDLPPIAQVGSVVEVSIVVLLLITIVF